MGRWIVPFVVGLVVVGAGLFGLLYMNRGSHVELKGDILKVRTIADGDGTIVFADFRVNNPSSLPFVVNTVKMTMETTVDEMVAAVMFSKSDVEKVTKYLKALGLKYNDVLSMEDELPPAQAVDRMAAGRFPVPLESFQQHKTLSLRIAKGNGAEIKGEILKVHTIADGDGTIVFADVRVTNLAATPFVVSSVNMTAEIPTDEVASAVMFSKFDVEQATKYLKVLGPKYNDVLSIKDKVPPAETVDRMAAGRFAFPEKFFQQRKTLRLRFEEVDGAASEIVEKNSDKPAAK